MSEVHGKTGELREKADELFRKGKYEEALNIYSKIEMDDVTANNIGVCLVKLGKYDEAEKYYKIAMQKNPKNPNVYFNLGKLYYRKKKYRKSLKYFKKCVKIEPENKSALNNIGVIYVIFGKYGKAMEYYRKALSVKKDYEWTWYNVATLALKFGMVDEAKKLLRNLSLPEAAELRVNLEL